MPDMKHESQLYLEQHGARIIRDGSRLCLVYLTGELRRKRTRDLECTDVIAASIEAAEWLKAHVTREDALFPEHKNRKKNLPEATVAA